MGSLTVKFVASKDEKMGDGTLGFVLFGDIYDHRLIGPGAHSTYWRFDEFEAWCIEHGVRVTMQRLPASSAYDGTVYFDTEQQRFEFKMRWNV